MFNLFRSRHPLAHGQFAYSRHGDIFRSIHRDAISGKYWIVMTANGREIVNQIVSLTVVKEHIAAWPINWTVQHYPRKTMYASFPPVDDLLSIDWRRRCIDGALAVVTAVAIIHGAILWAWPRLRPVLRSVLLNLAERLIEPEPERPILPQYRNVSQEQFQRHQNASLERLTVAQLRNLARGKGHKTVGDRRIAQATKTALIDLLAE
jgi:hypothetical protein